MFLFFLDKEKIYHVKHQILFVFIAGIKEKNPDTSIIIKQNIQEPVSPSKRAKENTLTDVEILVLKKDLQRFGIRYTTKVILMRRLMFMMIHQLKLMVV